MWLGVAERGRVRHGTLRLGEAGQGTHHESKMLIVKVKMCAEEKISARAVATKASAGAGKRWVGVRALSCAAHCDDGAH